MGLKDRVEALEQKTQKIERLYKCSQGQHDLCFYDLGESSIPRDYYIRHVCKGCDKIFQRSLTDAEIKLLKITTN